VTYQWINMGIIFLCSAIFSYLQSKFNFKITPSERCSHDVPTPTGGGLSILLTSLAAMALLPYDFGEIGSCWLLSSIILLAGVSLYDDHYGTSYRFRLCVHAICAVLIVASGPVIEMPYFAHYDLHIIQNILTVLVIISFINATNFIDGLNGLLSGCVMITFVFALQFNNAITQPMIYILIPSILGFYIFNFPKARLFMGDIGSTFLGFTLILIALLNQSDTAHIRESTLLHKSFFYTLLPMMFLWFDVFFTLLSRIVSKRRVTEAYRDYLFHHLNDKGLTHAQVSLIYYGLTLLMGCLTYLTYHDIFPFLGVMVIYFILQLLFLLWALAPKIKIN
jgi:UDP-GlcNAc:undecaprenyl-phosphate/decaprenyl-phosphate GlcNAc-1-phosphate transferase